MGWLKKHWGWIAVMVGAAAAFLAGRGLTKREIASALALRKLNDATASHTQAQRRADELKAKSDHLAERLLEEELILQAQKKEANALSPDAVIIDLKRRKIIK
jgi:ABC-type Fe2+-enterobactin transport system substrate-binding protein